MVLLALLQLSTLAASTTAATIDLGQYFPAHLPKPDSPPPAVANADDQLRLDIAYLARELPRVYAGGDGLKHISVKRFRAEAESIEQQLPTLTRPQLYVRILQLLAQLRDGETGLVFPTDLQLPITTQWFGDQLRLLAVPKCARGLLGGQVLAVNATPIATVHSLLRTVIPAVTDWESDSLFTTYLRSIRILQGLGIAQHVESVTLTVRDIRGHIVSANIDAAFPVNVDRVTGAIGPPPTLAAQHSHEPYWWQYIPDHNIVYIKYNQCVVGPGFGRLADQAVAAMRTHPHSRLIVDFRGNGGGNSAPFQRLIDDLRGNHDLDRRGRIYGLIDRYVFSSATLNAVQLQADVHGLLVGQPTGDPGNQWGDQRLLYLTGYLPVHYSTHYFDPSGRYHHKPNVTPDIPVATTLLDILTGDDPVLRAVEQLS